MATRKISRSCLKASSSSSSSSALSFLQLTPRRHLHVSPAPIFDFLLPKFQSIRALPSPPRHDVVKGKRAFTNTARRQETRAILNPQKDDEGQDMNIEITPRAASRLQEIMKKDSNPNLALRISVESGGCHGFQYLLSTTTLPPLSSEGTPALNTSSSDPNAMPTENAQDKKVAALTEEDVVFAEDGSGAKVVIDASSLELLRGSLVDFTKELIGSSFKVVNKNATSSCGCGTSFDIKF